MLPSVRWNCRLAGIALATIALLLAACTAAAPIVPATRTPFLAIDVVVSVDLIRETAARFRRVQEAIPPKHSQDPRFGDHFIDHYLDPKTGTLWVYLGERADESKVRQAVSRAFGGGRFLNIQFVRANITPTELGRLSGRTQRAVYAIETPGTPPRVSGGQGGTGGNRLHYGLVTPFGAWRARQNFAAEGIPQEAVLLHVRPPYAPDRPAVLTKLDTGLTASLEAPAQVVVGQTAWFALVLSNPTAAPITASHYYFWYDDLAVFNMEGDEVWSKQLGGRLDAGEDTTLLPGEQLRLETSWTGLNLDGLPVRPGPYQVRAWVEISTNAGDGRQRYTPATALQPLQVACSPPNQAILVGTHAPYDAGCDAPR